MKGIFTTLWATTLYFATSYAIARNCLSGNTYTTQEGDTCDSIALSHSISAATMFYTNPNILNCSSILPGTPLCLPLQCDVYTVQPGDTCTTIALKFYSRTQNIISYNSQLSWDCSNLHSPDPYWGSTVCVSVPGGEYPGRSLNRSVSGLEAVDPPVGVAVAMGSTMECGAWFVYDGDGGVSCVKICLANGISIGDFIVANPSLGRRSCDSDLVVGGAYCVKPLAV
ncbi:LysM peptidoglycan-binding domain-containing protein [Aspergillus ibericus CBS 121593]|uniref:LysM domain-containing protein n=1 Tax=Aspergillus ibericus CBS 121593 TaxID=1448316 RepID=A0A395H9E2_9EURO|nr:hypothetical protein BO80DRAFT_285163 [Aspergillus ibericus CBS 121593]RAL03508.1 hypothetical protein BO80DRAFT_285163 [Aspergillus ibericus CBS 121593]